MVEMPDSALSVCEKLIFKQEGAAQSRKVRPKNGVTAAAAAATAASSNANRGSLKLEELSTVKTEEPSLSPTVADCSVTGAAIGAGASSVAAAGAVATANRASDAKPKPKTKHRLLIKIPRSAVNAATAHAAEVLPVLFLIFTRSRSHRLRIYVDFFQRCAVRRVL